MRSDGIILRQLTVCKGGREGEGGELERESERAKGRGVCGCVSVSFK